MKPLDERHLRAAALLGRGASAQQAADDVGVTRRSVTDWRKREDFQEAERAARAAHENEAPTLTTMRAVLEDAALNAVRPDGSIDYAVRVTAAKGLIGAEGFGAPPEPPPPEVQFFDDGLEDDAPDPIDLAAEFAEWGGAAISQREQDAHERSGHPFVGEGWDAA